MDESKPRQGPPRRVVQASGPLVLKVSGRRWFPLYAIMHHVGRRSGTRYDTPIAVVPTVARDIILIGLPWGAKTNWARNVLAAGGATLTWKGGAVHVTEPRLLEPAEAAALVKRVFRPVIARFPAAIVLTRQ